MKNKLEELIDRLEELEEQSGWEIFSSTPLIRSGRTIKKEDFTHGHN